MREILEEIVDQLASGADCAVVTLVADRGSAPRAAGARMLVRGDGTIAGTIGGGLLEATMMRHAAEAIRERRSRTVSMQFDGREVTGEAMICGGAADVLIAYVPAGEPSLSAVCAAALEARRQGRPAWLFTIFGREDEAVVEVAWCLLAQDDELVGDRPAAAEELLALVAAAGVHGTAALAGGRRVHVERLDPDPVVVICGAGHVARALAPVAAGVGFRLLVLDDRPEFADPSCFPAGAEVRRIESFDAAFEGVELTADSYVVVVTRGHAHDFTVLTRALRSPAAYVGLMASRAKGARILEALTAEGFSEADLRRVRTPIGLTIGAETPAELAISIVAELIQTRATRTA